MHRRDVLAGMSAGLATLAGCSSIASTGAGDPPQIEWEFQYDPYLNNAGNIVVVVLGTAENVGGQPAEEFELTCRVLATDGSMMAERTRRVRHMKPNEEKAFHFTFRFSAQEGRRANDVTVEGAWPETPDG